MAEYETARMRGLSVQQSIRALKLEGIAFSTLLEVYWHRFLAQSVKADNSRLDELNQAAVEISAGAVVK
jgi:hypothetical protein